jgi:hypothetical protein
MTEALERGYIWFALHGETGVICGHIPAKEPHTAQPSGGPALVLQWPKACTRQMEGEIGVGCGARTTIGLASSG